jgi:type III pantothenate kinase
LLLAVDAGNTQTVFGLFDDGTLRGHRRAATEPERTGDELGVLLDGLLDLDRVEGIVFATSVPALVPSYEELAAEWVEAPILVVGPGTKTGIAIRYDDPREVAADRIANAVGARERHGAPCIVVDFGTSTNFDIVSADGEFVGGVLAPGIEISMAALASRAARLFQVDFSPPQRVIGKTTASALQSGLVYGFVGQVEEIVSRVRGELGVDARAVATGGLAELIVPHCRTIETIDPFLTLEGLRLIWEQNQ